MARLDDLRVSLRVDAQKLRDNLAKLDHQFSLDNVQQVEWIRRDGARLVYHPPPVNVTDGVTEGGVTEERGPVNV